MTAVLELVPPELWWLVVIAFIAGLVDAAVGGGGLVQLPGLFTVLPQQTPAMLEALILMAWNATNDGLDDIPF